MWFQLFRADGDQPQYEIRGQHDMRAEWLAEIAKCPAAAGAPKVVPRIMPEGENMVKIFMAADEMDAAVAAMVDLCREHNFAGLTLELWSRLNVQDTVRQALRHLALRLGRALRAQGKVLVLVVPPDTQSFGPADFAFLAADVDYFSLNTYDHATSTAGPVAPLAWARSVVRALKPQTAEQRQQLLLGINFYGYKYPAGRAAGKKSQPEALTGAAYVELLQKAQRQGAARLSYDDKPREHVLQVPGAVVYYPTQQSVQQRVQLAANLSCGLAIWELGQGLQHFFNVL